MRGSRPWDRSSRPSRTAGPGPGGRRPARGACIETMRSAALLAPQAVAPRVLRISDRAYVFRNGSVSYSGPAVGLANDAKFKVVFL